MGELPGRIIDNDLPGILAWALRGWKRLDARGRFDQPKTFTRALDGYKRDNDPYGEWIEECIEPDPDYMVDRRDIIASMHSWLTVDGGFEQKDLYKPRGIHGQVRKKFPHLVEETHRIRGQRLQLGLRITTRGIDLLEEYYNLRPYEKLGSGAAPCDVNKLISKAVKERF